MKIILAKDVDKLGKAGAILKVKDGYARNYLIPRGLALFANEKNVKELNFIKQTIEKRINAELAGANDLAAKLAACEIKIVKKVGDEGKLFGSVTAREISDALKEKGFDVDHRSLVLDSNIKKSGVYEVEVKLFRGVRGVFKLWVVSDESERQEENEPETAPVEE